MMKKFEGNSEEMQFERFERFEKLLKKNKNKPNFEEMSPYEIINYLREEDVRKNRTRRNCSIFTKISIY